MKVDVTTPDDDILEQAEQATPEAEPQTVDAQVIEPEVEPEQEPAQGSAQEPGQEAGQEPEQEVADSEPAKKVDAEVFSIADIENARADARAANDRYLRLQAEWDNFRKRTAREREEERSRASERLVEKLLPPIDDLERAIDHASKTEPDGEFGQFVDGIKAMHAKLMDVLTKQGVEVIDPAGQPFDMNVHQAIARIDDPDQPDETVRDVYQKGYRMGGRLIRPAMVTVTKGGPARPAPTQDGGEPADQASEA